MTPEARPGAVVEFFESKKLLCAVCLEVKKNRLLVLTETDKEANIAVKRILHWDELPLDISLGRAQLVAELQDKARRRRDLMQRVAVEELWDLLNAEEEGFDCRQLAEICFSEEITSDHTSAVLRALLNESLYFKFVSGLFFPNSAARVEQLRRQQEREAERARELTEGSKWLAAVWRDQEAETPARAERYIQMLKDFCLEGVEAPSYAQLKKMLSLAQIPLPQGPFQLLVKLGVWGENENLYLHRFQIQREFPPPVLAAAAAVERDQAALLTEDGGQYREDLTHLGAITIDGPTTRDFDDALSVRFLDDGAEVGIHIADAAAYISPAGVLDEEAMDRATSLYLPDAKIPMLPPSLSEGLCSLHQGEDRLALSLLVRFDAENRLQEYRFAASKVRVARQLTYAEVNDLVDQDPELGYLHRLSLELRRQRVAAGALLLPLPEVYVWINNSGSIHISKVDREGAAQVLVSELMILANSLAAAELAKRELPAVYRSQAPPQERIIEEATDDLFLNFRQRRYLSRAEIGTEPKPHSGLGLEAYTTWTSPIRRYLDLVTQRQLKAMLGWGPRAYGREDLEGIIARVAQPQSRAQFVKRQWTKYWILKYIEQEGIKTLDALVLDRGRRTYHLLLPELLLEASLPLSEGKNLDLGDHFRVEVVRVDPREDVLKLRMH